MRSPAIRSAALVLVLAVAACAEPAPPPAITSLELTIVPASGGQAYVKYERDGAINGGHLSGDSVPFVHIDTGRVDSATLAALWDAARALGDTLLARRDTVPTGGRGYIRIQVVQEGREAHFVWPERTEHPDRRVHTLGSIMMTNRVGGW